MLAPKEIGKKNAHKQHGPVRKREKTKKRRRAKKTVKKIRGEVEE